MVFVVFFMAAYAILNYGLMFAAQQQLVYAAEEGARRALQWQPTRAQRLDRAEARVNELVGWVGRMGGRAVDVQICDRADPGSPCGSAGQPADRIDISLRYPYGVAPLVPLLPGLGALVPAELRAHAAASLDGAAGMTAASEEGG